MRVLVTFLSFAEDVFGGIENSIYNLCLGLMDAGHDVVVYTSNLGGNGRTVGAIETLRRAILVPNHLPEGNTARDNAIRNHFIYNAEEIARDLAAVVKDKDIETIIACDPLWGIVHFTESWRYTDGPIVLSHHVRTDPGLARHCGNRPYLFHRFVSHRLREDIGQADVLQDAEVIPNSFNPKLFYPGSDPSRSRIIFCNSRIDPGKGIEFLLQAFAQFRSTETQFELWLCGGESPFGDRHMVVDAVRRTISNLQLDHSVRILDKLRWKDIPEYIRQAFVVVLPTLYESFGRAAMEALACGVPVIAAKSGNLPDLIGDAGLLVEPSSSEDLLHGLTTLYRSPELYEKLRSFGPLQVSACTNANVARDFVSAIQRRL